MNKLLSLLVSVLLLVSVAGNIYLYKHELNVKPTHDVVLQWVKDPNQQVFYYGWYEPDGSAFNAIAQNINVRFGRVEDKQNVPVYIWRRIQ